MPTTPHDHGYLSTTATFFCSQGGQCEGNVQFTVFLGCGIGGCLQWETYHHKYGMANSGEVLYRSKEFKGII